MGESAASDSQLILLRHGETLWSLTGKHTGRTDLSLTAKGEREARRAGEFLRRRRSLPVAAFVSPRARARRTAALAGFGDAIIDDDLAEWDYGPVEGRTGAEVAAACGRAWDIFRDGVNVLPGSRRGESLAAVARRAVAAIERIAPALAGGDVLVVAHGHLLRILAACWLDTEPQFAARLELGTAAIGLLGRDPHGRRTVEGWNLAPVPALGA